MVFFRLGFPSLCVGLGWRSNPSVSDAPYDTWGFGVPRGSGRHLWPISPWVGVIHHGLFCSHNKCFLNPRNTSLCVSVCPPGGEEELKSVSDSFRNMWADYSVR